MTVHVCAPSPEVQLRREFCPTCKHSRRFVAKFYEWYAPVFTCLRCGDSWNEDGLAQRPFLRSWRKKAIRSAWDTYCRWRQANVAA